MKKNLGLLVERAYPYVIALLFCGVLYWRRFNFLSNANVDNLIDGIVTMESIVIGLIGAIIPVVLSMKNESKFVKYVFENDKNGLFRKYMTSTIGIGLLSVAFSLAMYIRNEYPDNICEIMYYGWVFLIVLFLLLTYRSMKYMIIIIFSPDEPEDEELKLSVDNKKVLREKYIAK